MQEVLETRRGIGDRAAPGPLTLDVRHDFPILSADREGRPLVWLDNAATTQKPRAVIDRLVQFYSRENANVHRAGHALGTRATELFEGARDTARRFLGARDAREIVFVRGTTEAINLVAHTWGRAHVSRGDHILVSALEHHSNLIPWQMLAAARGAHLRIVPIDHTGQLDLEALDRALTPQVRLLGLTHVSNALGTVTPVQHIVQRAHAVGAVVVIDGAQAVSHFEVDVQAIGADFYAFSGHKVFGPTGIGVLYGTRERLAEAPPWQGGGSMIADLHLDRESLYHEAPYRFEAGTPNIADAVALGSALEYLMSVGLDAVAAHDEALTDYAIHSLSSVPGLRHVGTASHKVGVTSFVVDGVPAASIGAALDRDGVAVRVGHHCAVPALNSLGVEAIVRPSLSIYNTAADVDALVTSIEHAVARARRSS